MADRKPPPRSCRVGHRALSHLGQPKGGSAPWLILPQTPKVRPFPSPHQPQVGAEETQCTHRCSQAHTHSPKAQTTRTLSLSLSLSPTLTASHPLGSRSWWRSPRTPNLLPHVPLPSPGGSERLGRDEIGGRGGSEARCPGLLVPTVGPASHRLPNLPLPICEVGLAACFPIPSTDEKVPKASGSLKKPLTGGVATWVWHQERWGTDLTPADLPSMGPTRDVGHLFVRCPLCVGPSLVPLHVFEKAKDRAPYPLQDPQQNPHCRPGSHPRPAGRCSQLLSP